MDSWLSVPVLVCSCYLGTLLSWIHKGWPQCVIFHNAGPSSLVFHKPEFSWPMQLSIKKKNLVRKNHLNIKLLILIFGFWLAFDTVSKWTWLVWLQCWVDKPNSSLIFLCVIHVFHVVNFSFIEKYGTHIVVGVKIGGKDVVYLKQLQNSSLSPSEVQSLLKKLADEKFAEDFRENLTASSSELPRKYNVSNNKWCYFF